MLSEYFPCLFSLYLVILLYLLLRAIGKGRHILLWLPCLTVGLLGLVGANCTRFTEDSFSSLYLLQNLLAAAWNEKIWLKLLICLVFSVAAWLLLRARAKKPFRAGLALCVAAGIFLLGGVGCAVCRYWNIPYRFAVTNDQSCLQENEENPDYPYYFVNYDVAYGSAGYRGVTSAAIPVYASPEADSELVAEIPAGQENVSLLALDFSCATTQKGWRYLNLSGHSFYTFPDYDGVTGYVWLEDLLDALASGQESFLYNCLARYKLLGSDDAGYTKGSFVTEDYSQIYIPAGLYLSFALFGLMVVALLLHCGAKFMKKSLFSREQSRQ